MQENEHNLISQNKLPRKSDDYSMESILDRIKWLEDKQGIKLQYIKKFMSAPEKMRRNIENLIGACQIPLGITGPLKVNGEYSNGIYFVPFATTEGILVDVYTRGMIAVTKSGGAETVIHEDEINTSPIFIFNTLNEANNFIPWINASFKQIKDEAEATTKYGKLKSIIPCQIGNKVILTFVYFTADAMGLNMINIATQKAAQYILDKFPVKRYYLRSNFSSDKKVSFFHLNKCYGKSVSAAVLLPRKIIKRFLNSTPEEMFDYYQAVNVSALHSGMVGMNGQFANALAAIFIACGQDVASIVNSSLGISTCEITDNGDLYLAVKAPSLVVATVGGGTLLPTQQECLKLLGCFGQGKAKKFTEIVAATLLAGEVAICAAFPKDTYIERHKEKRQLGLE